MTDCGHQASGKVQHSRFLQRCVEGFQEDRQVGSEQIPGT